MDEQGRRIRARKIDKLIEQADRAVQQEIQVSRKDKRLTQEATADLMGWTIDVQSNIEKGRRDLKVGEFIVLCQQLGLDPVTVIRRAIQR